MVEGLTFLINSSNFADDIVLYYVCIRGGSGWGVQKFDCKGRAWSCWPWRTPLWSNLMKMKHL